MASSSERRAAPLRGAGEAGTSGDARPPLGIYIHVPYCAARCGYCDFNTYVPRGAEGPAAFVEAAIAELEMAREQLGERPVETVFVGGGTPTLLAPDQLVGLLDTVRKRFGLAPDAEVSTEANPESVDPRSLVALREGGFTRISLGMQSAAPHVLATLDRVHTAGRAVAAAREARRAGFEHVSLDLIYGTPGESDADWRATLEAALSAEPDHISAYALTLEPGTATYAAVRRGTLAAPDDDTQAERFLIADATLERAGLSWYEISSWARDEAARCRHNLGYWRSHDWWGIGPGAHSHVAGVRWCNVLAPAVYAQRLATRRSPASEREILSAADRALEAVMLGLRVRDGLSLADLSEAGIAALSRQRTLGRVTVSDDRVRLTQSGRLLADAVARELSA